MNRDSRTAKSVKNSVVAMGFYGINLILQFFSRKIFLDYLGTEILGLNTTAMNLIQFLNLAELGISSAVGFTLYKPLHDHDQNSINEIVTLQGHLYRRIAWCIIAGAAVLMCFFPWIFEKTPLPLWYAYASFSVLLFSALLGYFVNYRQILLTANQQDYKVQYSYRSVMLLKIAFQMTAVYYFENGYVWWLIMEVLFSVIGSVTLTMMTKRTFPLLRKSDASFKELRQKYSTFTTKIKQLFFHKMSKFVLTQSSPLIIYAYASLTLVALYGNYQIIVMGVMGLVGAMFNSMTAGIGHLVVENEKEKIKSVICELLGLRFWINATLCFTLLTVTPTFITLWIGEEYNLPYSTLVLIVITLYINLSRYTIDAFMDAYGLYRDIWAPVTEAFINISMSVLLGYYFGLNGILSGVLISLVIIVLGWKPYFLFSTHLPGFFKTYHLLYLRQLAVCAVVWFVSWKFIDLIPGIYIMNFGGLIWHSFCCVVVFGILLFAGLYLTKCGVENIGRRFSSLLK